MKDTAQIEIFNESGAQEPKPKPRCSLCVSVAQGGIKQGEPPILEKEIGGLLRTKTYGCRRTIGKPILVKSGPCICDAGHFIRQLGALVPNKPVGTQRKMIRRSIRVIHLSVLGARGRPRDRLSPDRLRLFFNPFDCCRAGQCIFQSIDQMIRFVAMHKKAPGGWTARTAFSSIHRSKVDIHVVRHRRLLNGPLCNPVLRSRFFGPC
jgi:hypothetical protein